MANLMQDGGQFIRSNEQADAGRGQNGDVTQSSVYKGPGCSCRP
jgi:hypothetical protein